jgi:hypothetical protein
MKETDMGEQGKSGSAGPAPAVKIVRPGMPYYFNDASPTCPTCNSNAIEYRCRVREKPRTAQFKCSTCSCKFEMTRTLDTEPEGYESKATRGLVCGECGTPVGMTLSEITVAERVVCEGCGTVVKDKTGEQA